MLLRALRYTSDKIKVEVEVGKKKLRKLRKEGNRRDEGRNDYFHANYSSHCYIRCIYFHIN
ncbi:hypothetical protein SBF1_1700003 [Candidatus Desulfosporosinus infrequens]|uniref:Uncharacterized protein n=1 Tax=Candidatus Desulfosporosinus infrequens TaxID=2043169 RepID=A0A2U3KBQ9_9FIRM|nr:hypothetical protein SBF1_1700003 [Candidatus Desulfosporosinus infrequens]